MNGYTVGGTVRTTFTTAAELARRGHEVEVVSVYRRRERPALPLDPAVRLRALTDLRPAAREKGARWEELALARPSRLIHPEDVRYGNFSGLTDVKLLRFLRSVRDGVLVSTRPGLNLAVARFAPRSSVRVGQDHMHLTSYHPRLRGAIGAFYENLDAVTTLTQRDAEDYRALLGDRTRVEYVPNGVAAHAAHRAALTAKVVVAAGRLSPQKGFDRLLPVWARVAAEHPDWELRIFGAGRQRAMLQRLVDELGLGDRARLMGHTSRLPEELAAASVYVMTSRREGLPMVLLEAMSVGLPVVSYDCPTGPREIIDDGRDGLLVANGDAGALAGAITQLIEDADKRRALGAAAVEKAAEYDTAKLALRHEALFEELAAAKRRPATRTGWKRSVRRELKRLTGFDIVRADRLAAGMPPPRPAPAQPPRRYDDEARRIIKAVAPRATTPHGTLFGLIVATRHVVDHHVPGAIVECGAWRGGGTQAVARTLLGRAVTDRDLHLYDSSDASPRPTESDSRALADLHDARAGLEETGYPPERVHVHPGPVEETVPAQAPDRLALLRLDAASYASTRHELEHLYERLSRGGVLMLDGYDRSEGARRAADEFLDGVGGQLLLVPMASGRVAVKP